MKTMVTIYNKLGTREGGSLRSLLLLLLLLITLTVAAQGQTKLINIGGSVYGGACQADVGGSTFVNIGADQHDVIISSVYGGNDISGTIGTSENIPAGLEKAGVNGIDNTYNAFVRINPVNGIDHHIFIGNLFGGGNGDYDYTSEKKEDGTDNPYKGMSVPVLGKAYLELMGGTVAYVYGGGNNATVTSKTDICIDNESDVTTAIPTGATGNSNLLADASVLAKMGIPSLGANATRADYHYSRVFGGNNKAEMKIQPTWHLDKGKIDNLYSGGNAGDMTSPVGLLLEIDPRGETDEEKNKLVVNNVYGGCRKADVNPKDVNGNEVTVTNQAFNEALGITDPASYRYKFPDGFSARVLVRGGDINNVYGGNDITGNVKGGNAVGVYTSIRGNVFGGGNGSYPYTDNDALKESLEYGDYYYNPGSNSVQALNDFRPNAEQVSIRVAGTSSDKPTIIGGSIYVGGNSATLVSTKSNPVVHLKIGSHVIADKVFLGNNGEYMVANTNPTDVLQLYQNTSIAGSKFNSMNLTDVNTFNTYMEGCATKMLPTIVFDGDDPNDPGLYENYSSYFGSLYCGGNVGSIIKQGAITIPFSHSIIIFDKVVGGCNNANVPQTAYNAAYEGGVIGDPDDSGNKLTLNISGLKIQPKRWKNELDKSQGLEWNTYIGDQPVQIAANEPTGTASGNDLKRRFKGGNIYGGCYTSGVVNGNVVININNTIVDRDIVFDEVETDDETGEDKLYGNTYTIKTRRSGVILGQQGMDVLGKALNVFGGGKGKDTEIWGSATVNLNAGYTFQIFGGSEEGVIGKPNDGEGETVTFNGKTYNYNSKYSTYVNLNGSDAHPGVPKSKDTTNEMAQIEFMYGGGFLGPIVGDTHVNLGNGRVFNTFAGSCMADILGHTETYVGVSGFPYVRDYIYGGNDLGGEIKGNRDFTSNVRTTDNGGYDALSKVYKYDASNNPNPDVLKASAYIEYRQGRVEKIFGGCYGVYDYADSHYGEYFYATGGSDTNDSNKGKAREGYSKPLMDNAFVNFRPSPSNSSWNMVGQVYGAGQGYFGEKEENLMQNRSYILVDIPQAMQDFQNTVFFGGGECGGVGMGITPSVLVDHKDPADETKIIQGQPDKGSAIIDLIRGDIKNVYGGSYKEGVTRRTLVNVPEGSTIKVNNIFGGAYGTDTYHPCDVYEANVNYRSADAIVEGAIYGGNNNKRRTLYGKVNISTPVYNGGIDATTGARYLGTVYGAGFGGDSWSEYTEVNLESGAKVYEVYGGGQAGKVHNAESVQKFMNAYKPDKWPEDSEDPSVRGQNFSDADWKYAWTLGDGYDPSEFTFNSSSTSYINNEATNLSNRLVRLAEMDDRATKTYRYNTNVIINQGAEVTNYGYGGGLGADAVVAGTTYIALLGGTVGKDIYAAGTSGSVEDLHGAENFTASANAYIQGGTVRNVYGGGWRGSVGHHGLQGHHTGQISDVANNGSDLDGETHVVIGTIGGANHESGIPSVTRNVYGGGEGGAIFGDAYVTVNNGYIGYRYNANGSDDNTTDVDEHYEPELDDVAVGDNLLDKGGNVFGGGYVANSYVDRSHVTMWDGIVRGSLYGGGEIGPIGRGTVHSDSLSKAHISPYVKNGAAIYKGGETHVYLWGGHVMRDVFGGGRGYDNWGGEGFFVNAAERDNMDRSSKGYVFGSTDVHIRGGEIGTVANVLSGYGNVFGGGNEGFVYSATGTKVGTKVNDDALTNGIPTGGGGFYYKDGVISNGLTKDCIINVEPYCKVLNEGGITIDGTSYAKGAYVPVDELNKLKSRDTQSSEWGKLDTRGVIIHNALFAGGNITEGSDKLFANTVTVYGNAAASLRDAYNFDLISLGTEDMGGLYGDGNLTLVDGFREIHIDNYGTDYYSLPETMTYDEYKELTNRQKAYYKLKYVANDDHTYEYYESRMLHAYNGTNYRKGQKVTPAIYESFTAEEKANWTHGTKTYQKEDQIEEGERNLMDVAEQGHWTLWGVTSIYAGRPMNTIQRADMCGVFGSRLVLKGAVDRAPQMNGNVDYNNYTINRVDEVSLNKRVSQAGDTTEKDQEHGNYFGIYSSVKFLGNLTSDVFFNESNDIRKTDTKITTIQADGSTSYYSWKLAHPQSKYRNNGISHNKVALASGVFLEIKREEGETTGVDDWGYITGVIELDLINVMPGMGGGYVYAKNVHGQKTWHSDWNKVSLLDYNSPARTYRRFTYSTSSSDLKPIETSGNFVHNTKQIVDDCYPNGGIYNDGYVKSPAHYWYIRGSIYVYDQYISAYTGAANATAEKQEIPLTITAASNGRMTLRDVKPNYYAYYDKNGNKLGDTSVNADSVFVVNNTSYKLNQPISHWDYELLSDGDKAKFVDKTYVVIGDCKVNGTLYKKGSVLLNTDYTALKNSSPSVTYEEDDIEKSGEFTYFFRSSNILSHEAGYILTYDVNNPMVWNNYYTLNSSPGQANALNTDQYFEKSGDNYTHNQSLYTEGPTYSLTSGSASVYGQQEYNLGSILSGSVVTAYENNVKSHLASTDGQAQVEQAYVVTKEHSVKNTGGEEIQQLNPGSPIYKSKYTDAQWAEITAANAAELAKVCTSLLEFTSTDYVFAGEVLSSADIAVLKTKIKNKNHDWTDTQVDTYLNNYIDNAYYCTSAGKYGGIYFEQGKTYRALDTWCSMPEEERRNFTFNYDALDLLIDSDFSGDYGSKPQYDGSNPTKIYSATQPIDYQAEFVGVDSEHRSITYHTKTGEEVTINVSASQDDWLSRQQYEAIPNEKHHYSPITVTSPGNYYMVRTPFMNGEIPFTVGQQIDDDTYQSLGTKKTNVDVFVFTEPQTNEPTEVEGKTVYEPKIYYYCRNGYTINEKGEGKPVTTVAITKNNESLSSEQYTKDQNQIVPQGVIINAGTSANDPGTYSSLCNFQQGFVIHGTSPTEVSTLYVSNESDIHDLSSEKIITVVYLYEYEESDESGLNVTPVSERHIVNIHINFKSGVPEIGDITKPDVVLPGTTVGINIPSVTQGAYRVTESGWEIFTNDGDAATHNNGVPFYNNETPLYLYQDNYWIAYYAKTSLGKTYSKSVKLNVANYHDLKKVMDDKEHHYYIDHLDVKKEPKIYINDYTTNDPSTSQNGLDLLKDLFDLSLLKNNSTGVSDGVVTADGNLKGHALLSSRVEGTHGLEFILRKNLDHSGSSWTPIGNDTKCFGGNFHGDGHYITGLNNSLFGHLCGSVYNLGVMGSFTSAGVADSGDGYVENCWVKSSQTSGFPDGVRAVFGNPTTPGNKQIVNCYYSDTNAYKVTSDDIHGIARPMSEESFYNGTVAYNLNGFYLYKRYNDHSGATGTDYQYYTISSDKSLSAPTTGHYGSNISYCSSGYNGEKYVEDRFADGDFRYAGGTIPETAEERAYTNETDNKTYYYPIWPDDYIYFGQMLTYGWNEARPHEEVPSPIVKSGNRLLDTDLSNRVYRAPAYYGSKTMSVAHFNPSVNLVAHSKPKNAADTDLHPAYPGMTAIDFAGHNDAAYQLGYNDNLFYQPLLDDDGILSIVNRDETPNLLVYAPESGQTYNVLTDYFQEPAFSSYYDTNGGYRRVQVAPTSSIYGHLVLKDKTAANDHLLVDKQDFNCPIGYTMGSGYRMWYQRTPQNFVTIENQTEKTKGWEDVSLPFAPELVSTQDKGEITHFFSGSTTGHEYWLRQYDGIDNTATVSNGELAAMFTSLSAGSDTKTDANTFLYDYYYSKSDSMDANSDLYKTYYSSSRTCNNYPYQQAGTPYLIGFPGVSYYEFDLSGNFEAKNTYAAIPKLGAQTITFASKENAAIRVSDDEMTGVEQDGYIFRPNYLNKELAVGNFMLNATDGNKYEKLTAAKTVLPFRPYFEKKQASGSRGVDGSQGADRVNAIVFGGDVPQMNMGKLVNTLGDEDNLIVKAGRRKICVESQLYYTTDVRIVTPAGITLTSYSIQSSEYVETHVESAGVYIVYADGGKYVKKVIVR